MPHDDEHISKSKRIRRGISRSMDSLGRRWERLAVGMTRIPPLFDPERPFGVDPLDEEMNAVVGQTLAEEQQRAVGPQEQTSSPRPIIHAEKSPCHLVSGSEDPQIRMVQVEDPQLITVQVEDPQLSTVEPESCSCYRLTHALLLSDPRRYPPHHLLSVIAFAKPIGCQKYTCLAVSVALRPNRSTPPPSAATSPVRHTGNTPCPPIDLTSPPSQVEQR
ncbi:hypothetical protein BC832DRAFT_595800 [Gaertneriomyces semiglobifer]|nr:hypothetical protein BC832DRAFT_595800 [Gaertneriomyces semiglobifer]